MLKEALRDCVKSMPHGLNEHIDNKNMFNVLKSEQITTLMDQLETESGGAVDDIMVQQLRRQLDGLVISEIDKARGELCIM